MTSSATGEPPILTAVSSSTRQLFLLLRCINFHSRVQVQILVDGIRFSVDEFSYMEGMLFLEKSLFTTYRYNAPAVDSLHGAASNQEDDEETSLAVPTFSISLPSLLETLQIFGVSDPRFAGSSSTNRDPYATVFTNQAVGISGLCRLSYNEINSPFIVHLEEGSVRTTCELVTYEPSTASDIPFARDAIAMKVIMRGASLLDAINELATSGAKRLHIRASRSMGALVLSATSEIGSALVEFRGDNGSTTRQKPVEQRNTGPKGSEAEHSSAPSVLETFQVVDDYNQSYQFAHILHARRAMTVAVKVSLRGDEQGVLSMQFMIENLEVPGVSFVDFRFVPLVDGDEDDGDDEGQDSSTET